jgi:hypothetical protein
MTSGTMLREWFQSVLGRRCEVLETRYRTVAALRRALRGEHTLLAGVGLKLKTQRLILRALRPAPAAVAPSVTPHSAVLAALPPPLPKARKLSSSCSPGNCCATAPPIEATTSSSTSSSCTSLPAVVAAEDLANSSGFGKRMLQKMGWSGAGTKPANRPVEALATSERRGLGAAPLVSAESLLKKAAAGASSTAVMATKFLVLAAAQEQVVVGLEGEHVQEVVRISGAKVSIFPAAAGRRQHGRQATQRRQGADVCPATDKQVRLQGHPDTVAAAQAIIEARVLACDALDAAGETARARQALSRGKALHREQRWLHAAGHCTAALIHAVAAAAAAAAAPPPSLPTKTKPPRAGSARKARRERAADPPGKLVTMCHCWRAVCFDGLRRYRDAWPDHCAALAIDSRSWRGGGGGGEPCSDPAVYARRLGQKDAAVRFLNRGSCAEALGNLERAHQVGRHIWP